MNQRCQECGRRLTASESQHLGIGPTCLEHMRERGLVVGGKQKRRRIFAGLHLSRGAPDARQVDWLQEQPA
jgi:hypothetical protein